LLKKNIYNIGPFVLLKLV